MSNVCVCGKDKCSFKSSPLSILDNTLKMTWLAAVLIITNFAIIASKIKDLNTNIDANIIIISLLGIFVVGMAIFYTVQWMITCVSYNEDSITVFTNIFVKDKNTFLIKSISGVVVEQNIFEKIFCICRVKVYTEGEARYKDDLQMVVAKEKAITFRNHILQIKQGKSENEKLEPVDHFDINLSFRYILVHSFMNISIGNVFIIVNIILLVFSMISQGNFLNEIMYNLLGFAITIFGIALPIIYSIGSSILKFYRYQLKREGKVILVRYGLLTTKDYLVLVDKINGVTFTETIISRIFGFKLLRIICAGVSNKKNELDFLTPFLSKHRSDQVLKILLPDTKFSLQDKLVYQPNLSISIFLTTFTIINLIVIPFLIYLRLNIIYIGTYMLLSIFMLWVMYYFKKISMHDTYILISTGIIIKKISLILYHKVKYVKVKEGAVATKFNIFHVSLFITAGMNNVRQTLGYVSKTNLLKITKRCMT